MGATSDGRMFGAKVETSLIRLSLLLAAAWRGGEEETMSYVKPKTFQRPINYRILDLPNPTIFGSQNHTPSWSLLDVLSWCALFNESENKMVRSPQGWGDLHPHPHSF